MPATLNAANEIAVQAFLDGEIRLSDVPQIIESVMDEHETKPVTNLETILECDQQARQETRQKLMILPVTKMDTRSKIADITN